MEGKYVMQERERLEAKLIQIDAERAAWKRWCEAGEAALGEALARAERAEAERDGDRRLNKTFKEYIDVLEDERDEALALVETLRGALESITKLAVTDSAIAAKVFAKRALGLAAPEALRQQQEREAEMVAMIEALREAIEAQRSAIWGDGEIQNDEDRKLYQALSVTPPQALAQQRERMERLMFIAQEMRGVIADGFVTPSPELRKALAEFDAERGQG